MKTNDIVSLWKKISKVIQDEMTENEEFAKKMEKILIPEMSTAEEKPKKEKKTKSTSTTKRSPAKIHPIRLWEEGEEKLRAELAKLDVEELKDVIVEYGWKWNGFGNTKKRETLESKILEGAKRAATRGDAFWNA